MSWMPHVTVAAIISRKNRFLMVKEKSDQGTVINQPAGHWEKGETLVEAVIRETREETAYHFVPEGLIGCYQWEMPAKNTTYLRFCFYGHVTDHDPAQGLDQGIISADWCSLEELEKESSRMRSPLVLACVNDYLGGKRYPLSLLHFISN